VTSKGLRSGGHRLGRTCRSAGGGCGAGRGAWGAARWGGGGGRGRRRCRRCGAGGGSAMPSAPPRSATGGACGTQRAGARSVQGGDKIGHFLAYAALAAGAVQLYARWPSLLGAGLGLVLMGIGLEWAQGALTETRQMERADALANTLGAIGGLATRLTPWRDL